MIYIAYAIHIITCVFLILVVLLQQGKGADLSVFGGGTTQAAFGARGAATLLHKLTVGFFILFMVTTVSIGVLQRGRRASSVMQDVAAPAEEPATTAPIPPIPAPAGAAAVDAEAPDAAASDAAASDAAASDAAATEAQPVAPADGAALPAAESEAPAQPTDGAAPPPSN